MEVPDDSDDEMDPVKQFFDEFFKLFNKISNENMTIAEGIYFLFFLNSKVRVTSPCSIRNLFFKKFCHIMI
jgi:hypothetical protein